MNYFFFYYYLRNNRLSSYDALQAPHELLHSRARQPDFHGYPLEDPDAPEHIVNIGLLHDRNVPDVGGTGLWVDLKRWRQGSNKLESEKTMILTPKKRIASKLKCDIKVTFCNNHIKEAFKI